jgi:hypothetical protein
VPIELERGKTVFLRFMGKRFLVEIESVADDTIAVSFGGSSYPIDGLGVELEFHDFEGVKTYHTQVVSGPREPGDSMILRRSAGLTRKHHRRGWRVPLETRTEIREPFQSDVHKGVVINVSSEGALIETTAPLEVGEAVELPLVLPKHHTYNVTGRVIRKESLALPGGLERYGLVFVDTPPKARKALTRFIWSQIRRLYSEEARAQFLGQGKREDMMKQRARQSGASTSSDQPDLPDGSDPFDLSD